jgi:5-methylcytosine-specific restriction protein A
LHKHVGRFGDSRRGSRQSRGYGAAWDALRKRILSRDKGLCQVCLSEGRLRPAREVDHKVPKSQGGTDADDNLQAICTPCHKAKTALEAQAGAGRPGGPPESASDSRLETLPVVSQGM